MQDFFERSVDERRSGIVEGVGTTPAQPAEDSDLEGAFQWMDGTLLEELWRVAEADSLGMGRAEFGRILLDVGAAQNYGLDQGTAASLEQRASYLRTLKLADLALARACAAASERAWERFIAAYRQPLERAAIAISGNETVGRELADQLYGELYGLSERDGERKCPLQSYRGRGSLMGWLRTVVAQRHVDRLRRDRREEPLEELEAAAPEAEQAAPPKDLKQLEKALEAAIGRCNGEERLILAAYYLDGRTLLEIAHVLNVHEATVSRKLKRLCEELRKRVVRNLQGTGMSRRAADEVLGVDPRDLDVNVKKLLQFSQVDSFKEKAAQ